MSWLFSQALVEEYLGDICSDGEQSVLLNGNHIQLAYCAPDKMTAFSRPSRFGMTFKHLTDDLGEAVLMWCLEASRAKTYPLQERARALTENAPACGDIWRGSLARFDPATSSWRTAQPSVLEDLGESSVIWPRSGMTANGQCWELPMLGRRTAASDSGLFPTPSASHCELRPAKTWNPKSQSGRSLGCMAATAMWPTPTVCGNYNRKGLSKTSGDGLATAVLKCATPTARDWRSGKASQATMERNSRPLSEQIGGSLNPTWVEWLMGWPLGWTDLKPLEMDKSHYAPQPLGDC
jgi:hypothetical protein